MKWIHNTGVITEMFQSSRSVYPISKASMTMRRVLQHKKIVECYEKFDLYYLCLPVHVNYLPGIYPAPVQCCNVIIVRTRHGLSGPIQG